jgi:hypothetical protein
MDPREGDIELVKTAVKLTPIFTFIGGLLVNIPTLSSSALRHSQNLRAQQYFHAFGDFTKNTNFSLDLNSIQAVTEQTLNFIRNFDSKSLISKLLTIVNNNGEKITINLQLDERLHDFMDTIELYDSRLAIVDFAWYLTILIHCIRLELIEDTPGKYTSKFKIYFITKVLGRRRNSV